MENHIKNTLFISLDTSQEDVIQIGKENPEPPSSEMEMKKLILLDRATLCEALVVLIRVGKSVGISEEEAMATCIEHLKKGLEDATYIAKLLK